MRYRASAIAVYGCAIFFGCSAAFARTIPLSLPTAMPIPSCTPSVQSSPAWQSLGFAGNPPNSFRDHVDVTLAPVVVTPRGQYTRQFGAVGGRRATYSLNGRYQNGTLFFFGRKPDGSPAVREPAVIKQIPNCP